MQIGQYTKVKGAQIDEAKHTAALAFLKDKGKRNPTAYGHGGIVVHHKRIYYFINTQSYKWCNRRRAHQKWHEADSMEGVWRGMEQNSRAVAYYKKKAEEEKVE